MKEYISKIMKQFLGFQFSNLVQFQNLALTQKVVLHLGEGRKRLRATLDGVTAIVDLLFLIICREGRAAVTLNTMVPRPILQIFLSSY